MVYVKLVDGMHMFLLYSGSYAKMVVREGDVGDCVGGSCGSVKFDWLWWARWQW